MVGDAARRRRKRREAGAGPIRAKSVDQQQSKRIVRLEKKVAYIAQPELKNFSTQRQAFATNTNAAVLVHLSTITQGTGDIYRVGDRIMVKHLRFELLAASSGVFNWIRVILFQDNRYDGTDLLGAEMLYDYSVTNTYNSNFLSPFNSDFVATRGSGKKMVRILADLKATIAEKTTAAGYQTSGNYKHLKFDKYWNKGLEVNFNGAAYETGQIYAMILPGRSTTAADNPEYSYNGYIEFTDI